MAAEVSSLSRSLSGSSIVRATPASSDIPLSVARGLTETPPFGISASSLAIGGIMVTPDMEGAQKTALVAFAQGIVWRMEDLVHATHPDHLRESVLIASEKGNSAFLDACMGHPRMTLSQKFDLFCWAKDPSRVRVLLENGIGEGPEKISRQAVSTALLLAASADNIEIVRLLLNLVGIGNEATQVSREHAGWALDHAAAAGKSEAAALLLGEIGIGKEAHQLLRGHAGKAFIRASELGHVGVISAFLDRIDIGNGETQISRSDVGVAFARAALHGFPEVVTVLLEGIAIGHDANQIPKEDVGCALGYAAAEGHAPLVHLLLDRVGVGEEKHQISVERARLAMDTAVKKGHSALAQAIQAHLKSP